MECEICGTEVEQPISNPAVCKNCLEQIMHGYIVKCWDCKKWHYHTRPCNCKINKRNQIELNSLYYYENVNEYKLFVNCDMDIGWWKVYNSTIENRLDRIRNSGYFAILTEQNELKNIRAEYPEMLSWLDTMVYMLSVIKKTNTDFSIVQELKIPYTKRRIDFVLMKDNKLLIIEFSYHRTITAIQERFDKKLTQAVEYKELLQNLLPSNIQIATYTCLIYPECDENGFYIEKNEEGYYPNTKEQEDLASYINNFFSTTRKDAQNELNDMLTNLS